MLTWVTGCEPDETVVRPLTHIAVSDWFALNAWFEMTVTPLPIITVV